MKTLIITGASKGIGFETAKLACDAGVDVINISRTQPRDERIKHIAVDLKSSDAAAVIQAALTELITNKTSISLIHNAAQLQNDTVQSTSAEALSEALAINVVAPQMLNQLILPYMDTGSSVLYLGSTLSEKAVANTFTYVTTKHAVVGMMRATCQDMIGKNIHTACICPGFTDTEMLRTHVGEDPEVLDHIGSLSTFGRLVSPIEIAKTLIFAAQNPVLNGAVIHANLGQIES